jgi:hypothetical protein
LNKDTNKADKDIRLSILSSGNEISSDGQNSDIKLSLLRMSSPSVVFTEDTPIKQAVTPCMIL